MIFRRFAESWSGSHSGLPDLLIWRCGCTYKGPRSQLCTAGARAGMIEVKSENDKLSEKQRIWNDVLRRANLFIEVAKVK
mmetsp:Transcript_40728/g.105712  ORF Transcript_40728/g.105712 Transcript_40728/m.105712 type:complete len:80 (-) Transcript_40728:121-360(-)